MYRGTYGIYRPFTRIYSTGIFPEYAGLFSEYAGLCSETGDHRASFRNSFRNRTGFSLGFIGLLQDDIVKDSFQNMKGSFQNMQGSP